MKQGASRKETARKRIRGLIVFLIVILSFVLVYDLYCFVEGWF